MATATKHSISIDGVTFTRKSDRPYTHAIIGPPVRTLEEEMSKATDESRPAGWWDLFSDRANGLRPERTDISERIAREFLAENPDRSAYVAKTIAEGIARVRKADLKGVFGWQPYSWHQGLANAQKALGKWKREGARIVEVGSTIKIEKA